MDGKQRREFLESLSDFTLYETFYEAGTMLGGGTLVVLERKASEQQDSGMFRRFRRERFDMGDDRNDTRKNDRERQIRLIERWNDRRETLEREYGLR